MAKSKISGFYKLTIPERLKLLKKLHNIDDSDYTVLKNGKALLLPEHSDRMVENVIGVFGLPMGLGLNFLINNTLVKSSLKMKPKTSLFISKTFLLQIQ